eukprot:scaffold183758_cov19-Tisochrysis_lutea.AAC.2
MHQHTTEQGSPTAALSCMRQMPTSFTRQETCVSKQEESDMLHWQADWPARKGISQKCALTCSIVVVGCAHTPSAAKLGSCILRTNHTSNNVHASSGTCAINSSTPCFCETLFYAYLVFFSENSTMGIAMLLKMCLLRTPSSCSTKPCLISLNAFKLKSWRAGNHCYLMPLSTDVNVYSNYAAGMYMIHASGICMCP